MNHRAFDRMARTAVLLVETVLGNFERPVAAAVVLQKVIAYVLAQPPQAELIQGAMQTTVKAVVPHLHLSDVKMFSDMWDNIKIIAEKENQLPASVPADASGERIDWLGVGFFLTFVHRRLTDVICRPYEEAWAAR